MSLARTIACVAGFLVLGGVGFLPTIHAQDSMAAAIRGGEIHEAIAARGIPVTSVRCSDGKYQLILADGCSAEQAAEAEQIKEAILANAAATLVVDNVQDALVVIQFEPQNESAVNVLKKRYAELKAAAKGGK